MLTKYIDELRLFIEYMGSQDLFVFLLLYTVIIFVYAVFIWFFYKSLSKRDLFQLKIKNARHPWLKKTIHVLKYLIGFPLMTFLWFAGLTVIMIFLSKSYTLQNIMIISMAIIAATRITSYYRTQLSEDIAKMLPLGILAIFIVEPSYFSLSIAFLRFREVLTLGPLLLNYLIFIILLEFILRVSLAITRFIRSKIPADGS